MWKWRRRSYVDVRQVWVCHCFQAECSFRNRDSSSSSISPAPCDTGIQPLLIRMARYYLLTHGCKCCHGKAVVSVSHGSYKSEACNYLTCSTLSTEGSPLGAHTRCPIMTAQYLARETHRIESESIHKWTSSVCLKHASIACCRIICVQLQTIQRTPTCIMSVLSFKQPNVPPLASCLY